MEKTDFRYWDVFPKHIKQTCNWRHVQIPLSIRGNPSGQITFQSANMNIAWVDESGTLHFGNEPGSTIISVFDSKERTSVRHIQIEVTETQMMPRYRNLPE